MYEQASRPQCRHAEFILLSHENTILQTISTNHCGQRFIRNILIQGYNVYKLFAWIVKPEYNNSTFIQRLCQELSMDKKDTLQAGHTGEYSLEDVIIPKENLLPNRQN